MNEHETQNQNIGMNTSQPSWDLEDMVERVRHTLQEEIDPAIIRHTLVDILSTFENVTVRTFVPIFACKEAIRVLKRY
jgi:hypothetical protein